MKVIISLLVITLSLTGCGFTLDREKPEYVEPSITFAVPKQIALSDMEKEQVAEAQKVEAARLAEEARKAEEARIAEEKRLAEEAERKRIADLEAENQRKQKEAEEAEKARIAEIERKQQEANRELAERLEREKPKETPPPPPPPVNEVPKWIAEAMATRGEYAPDNAIFIMTTDMGLCPATSVGCTILYKSGKLEVRLKTMDEFVLFHEIYHTRGGLDECEADNFARRVTGLDLWTYPEKCAP